MFCTAQMLAAECGVSARTILAKAAEMEREGIKVKSRIGRPVQINRSVFMREMFPGWREEEENHEKQD